MRNGRRKLKNLVRCLMIKMRVWTFYKFIRENTAIFKVIGCNLNYARQIKRLRLKQKDEKIRVLFIVSEIAKWKEQKLYEAMKQSGVFEPIVGLSDWNRQSERFCNNDELLKIHKDAVAFFNRLGDEYVRTVEIRNGKRIHLDLSVFKPDIVFYTEQWTPCQKQDPYTVSKFALTFFTTYYVGEYFAPEWDCHQLVERLVYGYFCLNQELCNVYQKSIRFVCHTTKFFPTGHPGLDYFSKETCENTGGDYVIYAPHFSFPNPNSPDYDEHLSTFDWNGREILAYAQAHPEMKWVFKPHPLLREWILDSGFMTDRELADYFASWSHVGVVCEDGDYQHLFLKSRVMITDCGSFLTEYGATGNPVIHLISSGNRLKVFDTLRHVFETYYRVCTLEQMYKTFEQVLERGIDLHYEKRMAALSNANIQGGNASMNILDTMRKIIDLK